VGQVTLRSLASALEEYVTSREYRIACSAVEPRNAREEVHKHLESVAERVAGRRVKVSRLGPFTWFEGRSLLVYGPSSKYRVGGEEEAHTYYTTLMVSEELGGARGGGLLGGLYRRVALLSLLLPRREPAVLRLTVGDGVEEAEVPSPLQSLVAASIREEYEACGSIECIDPDRLVLSVHGERVYSSIVDVLDRAARLEGDEVVMLSLSARLESHGVNHPLDARLVYMPGGNPSLTVFMVSPAPMVHGVLAPVYLNAFGAELGDKLLDAIAFKAFEASRYYVLSLPRLGVGEREGEGIAAYAQCISFHTLLLSLAGQLAQRSMIVDESAVRIFEEYRELLLRVLLERLTGGR